MDNLGRRHILCTRSEVAGREATKKKREIKGEKPQRASKLVLTGKKRESRKKEGEGRKRLSLTSEREVFNSSRDHRVQAVSRPPRGLYKGAKGGTFWGGGKRVACEWEESNLRKDPRLKQLGAKLMRRKKEIERGSLEQGVQPPWEEVHP